ncbi:hypothetical protein Franean1_5018 [Parafrankia sp. EAN1pec]|nr:hypothetical protein Franean1_5018 [Frankia sp. EAN1pec]
MSSATPPAPTGSAPAARSSRSTTPPARASAEDFAGRVLTALALSPDDEGMPGTDEYGARGARWVECGRRPGYLQDTLGRLRSLAEAARTHDLTITWA